MTSYTGLKEHLESIGEGHLWRVPDGPPQPWAVALRNRETGVWRHCLGFDTEAEARAFLADVLEMGIPPERATLWALVPA